MDVETTTLAIDFGTTYSCVYVWDRSEPKVVKHGYGDSLFPSTVSIKDGIWHVGKHSKTDFADDFQVIHNVKRVIGRDKDDGLLMDDIEKWQLPYKLDDGQPYCDIDGERVSAIEITALIFCKAKMLVKKKLGKEATGCIITVPAYFTSKQIQATKDAARIAGLEVRRVISEPGAVAMAALHSHEENGNFLVLDVGGGTTDWSIINLAVGEGKRDFSVIAAGGNNRLGGEDFLHILTDHFKKKIPDAPYDELRRLCEQAKNQDDDRINVHWSGERYFITQGAYKALLRKLLSQMNSLLNLDSCTAKLSGIILAGGACQQRQIQDLVRSRFGGNKFRHVGALGEAVACGAAWLLDNRYITFTNGLRRSIGIEVQIQEKDQQDVMKFIVKRNERLPTSDSIKVMARKIKKDEKKKDQDEKKKDQDEKKKDQDEKKKDQDEKKKDQDEGDTAARNETEHGPDTTARIKTEFHLYEGEDPKASKNILLGKFLVESPAETGFNVQVMVKSDMEVSLTATTADGSRESLTVQLEEKSHLSDAEIEKFRELTLRRFATSEIKVPPSRKRKRSSTTKRR